MAKPIIEVKDLTFCYPGAERPAVNNVEFAVAKGEIFGFLGPSGAGKSTTQKVLIRLLEGYQGKAQVFGRELADWGGDFFERVGVCFELPASYRKLTALENLELFASLYRGDTEDPGKLLEDVGLGDHANQRVAQYSKGMQMRLNFARSLLNKPDLLFLDEPTGGLDPGNAARIKQIILQLREERGATVFLTTHDMLVADELCDRVAFMVDGELPVIASPRALELEHGRRRLRIELRKDGELRQAFLPLDDLSGLPELLEGAHVETMHTEEATLEQVFMAVTGRELS